MICLLHLVSAPPDTHKFAQESKWCQHLGVDTKRSIICLLYELINNNFRASRTVRQSPNTLPTTTIPKTSTRTTRWECRARSRAPSASSSRASGRGVTRTSCRETSRWRWGGSRRSSRATSNRDELYKNRSSRKIDSQ